MAVHVRYNFCYYISNSVRAPLLVNLAGRTLRHGSLKFKAVSIAKLLRDLRYDLWPARFALRPYEGDKNSVRNLRYGPRTQLVRGMYIS